MLKQKKLKLYKLIIHCTSQIYLITNSKRHYHFMLIRKIGVYTHCGIFYSSLMFLLFLIYDKYLYTLCDNNNMKHTILQFAWEREKEKYKTLFICTWNGRSSSYAWLADNSQYVTFDYSAALLCFFLISWCGWWDLISPASINRGVKTLKKESEWIILQGLLHNHFLCRSVCNEACAN